MKINKKELQEALSIVKPGLSNKEMIEQSTSFAFIKGKVITYNDEISISHPIEGIDIEGAIQAEELYGLLGKLKQDEIDISIKGNELILQAEKIKAGVSLQEKITLPLMDDIKEISEWKELPPDFIEAMKFTIGSCSNDMSQPVLTCLHINKNGYIESSDNFRLVKFVLKEEILIDTFLLPVTSVIQVIKLNPVKIAEGKGWVHFQTEEKTIISCRILEDKYPNTLKFYDVQGMTFDFPKTTLEALERASVFAKRDYFLDESIEIHIENKKLIIKSKSDSGWFEEKLNIRYTGKPIIFVVTPHLLKDILIKTNTCVLNEKMIKFEGSNWQYVSSLRETK